MQVDDKSRIILRRARTARAVAVLSGQMADHVELTPLPKANEDGANGVGGEGKLKKRESRWKQNLNASRADTAVRAFCLESFT